jgi:biotin carboxylase
LPGVLIVAATTGYQTRAFTEAAQRLGIPFILATDRCHILENPWGDHALPVRFEQPEEAGRELASALAGREIAGVVGIADRPALVAAFTAQLLGLQWHAPEAAAACRNKNRMRQLFEAAGLQVPRYGLAGTVDVGFPCVLKPLGLSASRGVIRANDEAEYQAAIRRIHRIIGKDDPVQVEAYIPGREFALEGLMTAGELRTLAIFDKPDPLEGPFFEETIYVTPSRESAGIQSAIVETCVRAARALGLSHGPIHAEMRVNERGVYMLEIAARPIGGLCARALRFGNISLEELILLHAIGRMPSDLQPARPASGVMMIPVPRAGVLEDVKGLEAARAITGVDDVVITAKKGERLVPLPEGASYPGFIFASGGDARFVEGALRTAHRELRFDILATLEQVI